MRKRITVSTFGLWFLAAAALVAMATQSGSGSQYTAPGIDFWEHQGEATVKWSSVTYTCKPRESGSAGSDED